MLKKILSRGEIIAVGLMAFLSLILGGWQIMIVAVLVGVLIGLAAPHTKNAVPRAAVIGLVFGLFNVAITHFHNTAINTLPGQEVIPPEAMTLGTYLIAIALCVAFAALTALIHNIHDDRKRQLAFVVMLGLIAFAFPFFEQCPGLSWTTFNFADMAGGCAVKSNILWIGPVIVMFIYGLQAMGLNIVAGYAGLLDLGYVAFFAIGAYTMGLLNSSQLGNQFGSPNQFIWGFWLVIWIAAAMAALSGLVFGAPTLRLRGDYLAIVTLGFGEIVPIVVKNLYAVRIYEPITLFINQIVGKTNDAAHAAALCLVGCYEKPIDLTAGTRGISPINAPQFFDLYTFKVGEYVPWYFVALILLAVSAFFIFRLRASRIGRAWVSIREDELAANAMGIDLVRTKLTAFIIGAMFSGFAGAFYASFTSFISPDAFDFTISVIILAMVILGGSGNITGVLLGSSIIMLIDRVLLDRLKIVINGVLQGVVFKGMADGPMATFVNSLTDATAYKILLFGLILVVMMKVRPQGILPEATAARRRTPQ
ncbi:MAG: branched-chain amino acid ABC transporter permease [Thermoflexales bacterium]